MAWYYQLNPHDTHDWDSTETPILVDGDFKGKARKMVMHADRNGYFYVLDRLTGEHLLTSKFSEAANWAKEINAKGQTIRDVDEGFHRAWLAGVARTMAARPTGRPPLTRRIQGSSMSLKTTPTPCTI